MGPRGIQLAGRTGHTSAQARARVARSLPRGRTSAIAGRYAQYDFVGSERLGAGQMAEGQRDVAGRKLIIRGRGMEGVSAMRDTIDYLRTQLKRHPEKRGHLLPSYITAICAGMEAEINDEVIQHFAAQVPRDYRKYARPILFMQVQERARLAVLLSSNYRYELNMGAKTIKDMFDLFSFRNKLVHIQHHVQDQEITIDETGAIAAAELVPSPASEYWSIRMEEAESASNEYLDACREVYFACIGLFRELGWRLENKADVPVSLLMPLNVDGRKRALRPVHLYKNS
jgi:hypothetical protein